MSEPVNKQLYAEVVKEAKSRFKVWPSAYASMWVQKEYASKGGKFKQPKTTQGKTKKWLEEKWVNMGEYLDGKIVPCGMPEGKSKACRPIRKLKDTPITAQEVIKKHGRNKVEKLVAAKEKNMKGTRINWVAGTVSKKSK
jgi:hypothetical protein